MKLIFLLTLLCLCQSLFAKNYYFSSISGNDERSFAEAQNPNTPWKSIKKLNETFNMLEPGDSVLFKKGERFYGALRIAKSGSSTKPIVFSSYGSGEKPVITSLITLKSWRQYAGGIYETTDGSLNDEIKIVLLNNRQQELGRYPNADASQQGYLTIQSHIGNSSITGQGIFSENWVGADIVIRKEHWILDHHKIVSQSGNNINYSGDSSNINPIDKYGFFIQNHVKTLDKPGEWFYDAKTKKLYMYFGASGPEKYKIEAGTLGNLVVSSNTSGFGNYIVFQDLKFSGANHNAFLVKNGSHFTIQNCDIENSGENGITANEIHFLTVRDCKISASNNNGIMAVYGNRNAVIAHNTIDSTFVFPGMGQNGNGNGIGIFCIGTDARIENNKLTNTGYIGVSFGGDFALVKNNYINRFCITKDDGGGIYTYNGPEDKIFKDRKVISNIVLNGVGVNAGTDNDYSPAEGIYLDDNSNNVTISKNTIGNIASSGIYLHNARDIIVRENTVYNASVQLSLRHDLLGDAIRNINSYNNVFYAKAANQLLTSISTINDDVALMLKSDSNYFDKPVIDDNAIKIESAKTPGKTTIRNTNLVSWQKSFSQDLNSQKLNVSIPEYHLNSISEINKFNDGSFDKSISNVETYSTENVATSQDNKITNSSLKVSAKNLTYVMLPIGNTEKGRNYIVKFDAQALNDASLNVYLRQHNSPYKTLSDVKMINVSADKKGYELLMQVNNSQPDCILVFETSDNNIIYWLDNVKVSEAQVVLTNIDDYIRFHYNTTYTTNDIKLDAVYTDARNQTLSESFSLAPFSSQVIVKNEGLIIPSTPVLVADDQANTLTAMSVLGKSEILVSENNSGFKAYTDTIRVGNVNREKAYWKFKVKASEGRLESPVSESPEFTFKEEPVIDPPKKEQEDDGVKIYPNPATNFINIKIKSQGSGPGNISIYNFQGTKVASLAFTKDGADKEIMVPISNFSVGVHVVVIRVNGQTFIQKIIKF